MSHLVACSSCQRHVRITETFCPFCGDALPMSLRGSEPPRTPTTRLGRAAIFAFGAALAAATGCGDSHTADDGGSDVDAGAMVDAGWDSGMVMAAYGPPPPPDASLPPEDAGPGDAGADTDGGPPDAGMIFPPYGAPPVRPDHFVI